MNIKQKPILYVHPTATSLPHLLEAQLNVVPAWPVINLATFK
jgi:hypothetical protein